MNKKISLIFFLTIILKPIFTKIAFPLCSIKKFSKIVSTAECDSFGQHILSPFHHFESYFIIITILTYIMWYFGYINFDNLDLKSVFDNKVFKKIMPKSTTVNNIKIKNIFSLRNIKIFFNLLLLFIPFVNLIYVILIFKKYRKWLKNEIISQSKINKILTIILIFTLTVVWTFSYIDKPQLLLGIPAGILIVYHMPRIIAYVLLNRLSISNITKTYNKTLTVLMLLFFIPLFFGIFTIILLYIPISKNHYWVLAGGLLFYAVLYVLYRFKKNTDNLTSNKFVLEKVTFNPDSMKRFFKLSLILFVLIIAWDIIANLNNFKAVFIFVFVALILFSFLLGFIVQLFKTKWTILGTTNNWLIVWCVSVIINIIILF